MTSPHDLVWFRHGDQATRHGGPGLGYSDPAAQSGGGLGYSGPDKAASAVSNPAPEIVLKPVFGGRVDTVTNSRFLALDTLERLNEAERESTVIRKPDLCDLAKSVHAYYAISAVPEAYSITEVQLGYLAKLTGVMEESAVAADLTESARFSSALQKYSDRVCDPTDLHSTQVDVIIFESEAKSRTLLRLKSILTHLKTGGNCVYHCHQLRDRFTVSVVYLLSCLFGSVTIVKTKACCPHTPDLYIVAKSLRCQDSNKLMSGVDGCLEALETARSRGKDVVEILPISLMFQPSFYKFVSAMNEKVSLDAFDTIMDLEKMNYQNSFPSGKSNKFILECVNETQKE